MIQWRSIISTVAAVCSTAPAYAQPAERNVRVGLLCAVSCDSPAFVAFKEALLKLGWVEGRNLVLDARGAGGRMDQLPALAREIAASKPDLIVASSPQPAKAAQEAAGTIPMVFIAVADPVTMGLVRSLGRPGGNVTGMSTLAPGGFIAKHFELIRELAPGARRIAVLMNPGNEVANTRYAEEGPQAATRLGMQIQMFEVREPSEITPAIETAARQGAGSALCSRRSDVPHAAGSHPAYDQPRQAAFDLSGARGGRRWRASVVRTGFPRYVSPRGRACRPGPEGGESGGSPCRATDQVSARRQSEDGEGDRVQRTPRASAARGRSDRVTGPGNREPGLRVGRSTGRAPGLAPFNIWST